MAANLFRLPIAECRCRRYHWLVVQVMRDVRRQPVGRFVTARAVLLQALQHNPVQVAMDDGSAWGVPAARRWAVVVAPRLHVLSRVVGLGGSFSRIIRITSSKPPEPTISCVEWRAARQQFVEQHAEAVDVAAGVHVQAAQARLLRTHVGRRADELVEPGKDRLVRQPFAVALAMPKSITLGTGTPSFTVTRMFDGLMSRWMMPFWCACWMAWQTWMNSSSRSRSRGCSGRSNR